MQIINKFYTLYVFITFLLLNFDFAYAQECPLIFHYKGAAAPSGNSYVSDRLGSTLGPIGDVNGDGVPDFYLGANSDVKAPNYTHQVVHVYSGKTGIELYKITSSYSNALSVYGNTAFPLGDINKDGFDDFAIGGTIDIGSNGVVTIFSGKTGTKIRHHTSPIYGRRVITNYGSTVTGGKDLNKDGYPDYIITDSENSVIYAHSGIDGSLIWVNNYTVDDFAYAKVSGFYTFGDAALLFHDYNNDNIADILVSASGVSLTKDNDDIYSSTLIDGFVALLSGANGDLLGIIILDTDTKTNFGGILRELGDLNKDGYSDLAVVATPNIGAIGIVYFLSGKDLSELYRIDNGTPDLTYDDVWPLSDVDNDGHADFMVYTGEYGSLSIYSGANKDLIIERQITSDVFKFSRAVTIGDINGDGYIDSLYSDPDFIDINNYLPKAGLVFAEYFPIDNNSNGKIDACEKLPEKNEDSKDPIINDNKKNVILKLNFRNTKVTNNKLSSTLVIKNNGKDAGNNIQIKTYISKNKVIDSKDKLCKKSTIKTLKPKKSKKIQLNCNIKKSLKKGYILTEATTDSSITLKKVRIK